MEIIEEDFIPLENKENHSEKGDAEQKFNKEKTEPQVNRKARLIVRNLPYKVKEHDLKKHFSPYGQVEEVCILKRRDGKLVGCAFIQFKYVNEAAKAVHHANKKKLMDRPLHVAFALSKQDYNKKKGIKQENGVKEEQIKEELGENDKKPLVDEAKKKPRRTANDADDGKTIFIKNLPFETTEPELGKILLQFGPHEYALINKEPISGHSRGTGFVRFKAKESADLCLQNSGKVEIKSFTLEFFPAMKRTDAIKKHEEDKNKEPKDTRHLYLLKEGVILAGSSAAEDLSKSDMAKRLHLEKVKAEMLKNLNRFISRERLTIHNLPEKYDDKKLKEMVKKQTNYAPIECKVMRENKPSMGHPLGKSKGFGFLAFSTHDQAIQVLRKLNNNPIIFGKNNRPILSFSIEDKKAINLKKKRLEKSKLNNPTYQAKLDKLKENGDNIPGRYVLLKRPGSVGLDEEKPKNKRRKNDEENIETFSGITAKKGITRFRSKSKLEQQAVNHLKNVNKQKKLAKKQKKTKEIQKEKQSDIKTKSKRVQKDDNLSELFVKYKQLFETATDKQKSVKLKKRKWHEGVN